MSSPSSYFDRLNAYVNCRGIACLAKLGDGKDGHVWQSNRDTAIKVHERPESYRVERDAYIRFRDLDITDVNGFTIPALVDYDDGELVIEMDWVFPPYLVDFASAVFDEPPDLIEDPGHTLYDMVVHRFGERADEVMALYHALADATGVYLTDLHRHNIKFAPPESAL